MYLFARHTDRQTDRQADRQTENKETKKQTKKQTQTQTKKHTKKPASRQASKVQIVTTVGHNTRTVQGPYKDRYKDRCKTWYIDKDRSSLKVIYLNDFNS